MASAAGRYFGRTPDGQDVHLYEVSDRHGLSMAVCSYGAAIVSLEVPDASGRKLDVVLGFDNVEDYVRSIDLPAPPHFGAAIGRWAGRINKGIFNLNGTRYHLRPNNNGHSLHGGRYGFSQRVWKLADYDAGRYITFHLDSPDGDEDFPGRVEAKVRYELDALSLIVRFEAFAHEDTIVNMTQHSYFNLDGHTGNVLTQKLSVRSDALLETREMIPTGKVSAAEDTHYDHRALRPVPDRIDATFVLNREAGPAARLQSDSSGLALEVFTNQPAVHIYVGGDCFGLIPGKNGASYHRHSGICFETQNFPDAPNHAHFPSPVLRKGQTYAHETIYQFHNKLS